MRFLVASIGPTDPLWVLTMCAVVISAVLALGALIPAALGHFRSAILVAAPAFVAAIFTTGILVFFCFISLDRTLDAGDFVRVWTFIVGIPLSVSVFAVLLAWLRSCKKERLIK